jgi:thiol-disulfide isomerase/thioredoxin
MRKFLTSRTVLILVLVVVTGFAIFYVVNADTLADSNRSELDRRFGEMLILKVPDVSDPLEIRLKDINNKDVSISDFRGKIVFLNFWTTWCPACRIEMPSLEKLHQKFKNRDFAMVTINLQESANQVRNFFKEYKLSFTALLDTAGEVGAMFGLYQIPTTYILDKEGRIIGKAVGPRQWDSKKSVSLFEYLIDRYAASSGSKPID